jgi:hypothetical protein
MLAENSGLRRRVGLEVGKGELARFCETTRVRRKGLRVGEENFESYDWALADKNSYRVAHI